MASDMNEVERLNSFSNRLEVVSVAYTSRAGELMVNGVTLCILEGRTISHLSFIQTRKLIWTLIKEIERGLDC